MCGIVGYVGQRDIASVLLVGLERLSYRGYDSSGIAVLSKGELSVWKQAGKIHELDEKLKSLKIDGELGIGHTRWATHGQPTQENAHPHLSTDKKIAVVHNGIIENYLEIRNRLIKLGYFFRSDTDTEVIVKLVEYHYDGDMIAAIERATEELKGSYAIAIISEHEPNKIFVCRKGSPLVIGLGKEENYIASDIHAIITHTKNIIYLNEDELATVTQDDIKIKKIGGSFVEAKVQTVKWDATNAEKQGYPHYMLKEIFEQPTVARNIISKYVNADNGIEFKHTKFSDKELGKLSRVIIQACGTSWHAGMYAKYLLESYARVLTELDVSSEFRYRHMLNEGNDVVIAISQSGETADTLACIREAKSKFFRVLSFVNVKNSSIARESDHVVYSHSGQEIGVASTKNYVAQLLCLYLFAIHLGIHRGILSPEEAQEKIESLRKMPELIEQVLNQADYIKQIADKYSLSREFLFIGRGVNYPTALEGALKLKEISYIHATGYAAGELKHGPIALIDSKLPVVCIAPNSVTYDKMLSNIQEVKARRGKTIVIASEGNEMIKECADEVIYIPTCPEELTPILAIIPLQLLAYQIAVKLECDVDQPRNLAKSVTVE